MLEAESLHGSVTSAGVAENNDRIKLGLTKPEIASRRIGSLFRRYGTSDYIGEPVSILEHSWQSYWRAMEDEKAVDGDTGRNTITAVLPPPLASLLHDVGHLLGLEAGFAPGMDGCGTPGHETVGGDFLVALGVAPEVGWYVSHHVDAKRYLVASEKGYWERLSESSRTTLGFQGGPMTEEEAAAFERDPRHQAVLRMRTYDEAAKVVPSLDERSPDSVESKVQAIATLVRDHVADQQQQKPSLSSSEFPPTACSSSSSLEEDTNNGCDYLLSSEQIRYYQENGYLVVRDHPLFSGVVDLEAIADALEKGNQETTAHPEWLVHRELCTDGVVRTCRVENYVKTLGPSSRKMSEMCRTICGQLFGEEAVLFKDKLNYKPSGGGAFLSHQDATAYCPDQFASTHISVLVAIDSALSLDRGPLEMAAGRHRDGIFENEKGVIQKHWIDTMEFKPVFVERGDMVFFSSYTPHRSAPNTSASSRRMAYLTYNKLSEGDFNNAYYETKLRAFQNKTAGPISLNDDFAGTIVD